MKKPLRPMASLPPIFAASPKDLLAPWVRRSSLSFKKETLPRLCPFLQQKPIAYVAQARQTWPVLCGETDRYIIDQRDIARHSFLMDPPPLTTGGLLEPVGYLLTFHTISSPHFFKPTPVEVLSALTRAKKEIAQTVGDEDIVAYDIASAAPFIGEAFPRLAPPEGTPFFLPVTVGEQTFHAAVAELFVGRLPEDVVERPIYCEGKRYRATRELQGPISWPEP